MITTPYSISRESMSKRMGTTDNGPYTKNGNSSAQRMPSTSEENELTSLRKQKPPNVSPNDG